MINIEQVAVSGQSQDGPFEGTLDFHDGLNVVSANNAYGKTMVATSIAWSLGLEPMFGLQANDVSKFPAAVRDVVDLGHGVQSRITSSSVAVRLRRDKQEIVLKRPIAGDDPEIVEVTEKGRVFRLVARHRTMADATGGLQSFLFKWMELYRVPLMTTRGRESEIYLENIAPHFIVDQVEGWSSLQALQVLRYGLIDIPEASVEYLLGAESALARRLAEQKSLAAENRLKTEAVEIAEDVGSLFAEIGRSLELSTHGKTSAIATRWGKLDLLGEARQNHDLDFESRFKETESRIESLRRSLSSGPLDSRRSTGSSSASQRTVNLKSKRHEARDRLRIERLGLVEQNSVLHTLEQRLISTQEIIRLKEQGIGLLPRLECPTCHQGVEPATLALNEQDVPSLRIHLDALRREYKLISKNIEMSRQNVQRAAYELSESEEKLREAQQALRLVNVAVGIERESLTKIATDLVAGEGELRKLIGLKRSFVQLQKRVDEWCSEVADLTAYGEGEKDHDLSHRISTFTKHLREMLLALGHSEVNVRNTGEIRLDQYVPYLNSRRLRSLGSASDHPRMIAAYALALALTSRELGGPHPGFVILDEPLQQNPDPEHRKMMLRFMCSTARNLGLQIIVFTSLLDAEVEQLRDSDVQVQSLSGSKFLQSKDL